MTLNRALEITVAYALTLLTAGLIAALFGPNLSVQIAGIVLMSVSCLAFVILLIVTSLNILRASREDLEKDDDEEDDDEDPLAYYPTN